MNTQQHLSGNSNLLRYLLKQVIYLSLTLFASQGIALATDEFPLKLPKVEGSKSFDMEIDQHNAKGIDSFTVGKFSDAEQHFRKGMDLARHLRDPSLGILSFNLALTLHKTGSHESATPFFTQSRKYARGNKVILDSALLRKHECGFNPSIDCKDQLSTDMTIEGSN